MKDIKDYVELLGRRAKDKVTGFSGTLESISFDLYGCIQFVIVPDVKDGVANDGRWFDANRISLVGVKKAMETPGFKTGYALDHDKGPANKPLP
jgi:hypothetical protein